VTGTAEIVGAGEARYARRAGGTDTVTLIADAAAQALGDAGLEWRDVDGLAVSSFSLAPDHAVDLAWRLGLSVRWLMQDPHGGASGLAMLQHARAAVAAGDARIVLIVAGDHLEPGDFARLVGEFSVITRDELAPLGYGGPNMQFALLMQRHMARYGLGRETYGGVAVAQRRWAARNPGAVYRSELTLEAYLAAPAVVAPLCRYDCVPVVCGADAVVVAAPGLGARGRHVAIRAVAGRHNIDHQEGDGLSTGLTEVASELTAAAGWEPSAADVISVYDDYTVMALIQLHELGLVPDGDLERFVSVELVERRRAVNTSGGQLSAGQAGAAGGLHGLVEAVRQLRGAAGERQVHAARTALVTGYGMVLYRYGASAAAALLATVG
jgi:acetyl-CoA acetyltransferase